MKTKEVLIATVIVLAASTGYTSAQQSEVSGETLAEEKMDIVEVASDTDDFSTLVGVLKSAGLIATLRGDGPFTIFAPTNAAFEELPDGVMANLMKPENKAELVKILSYHVVPSKVMAADISPMDVKTAEGASATVTIDGLTIMINNARVIKTDVIASNGVIHVIDKVIMPPEQ